MQSFFRYFSEFFSGPKISQFFSFNYYARLWVLGGLVVVILLCIGWFRRRWVLRHSGKVLTTVIVVVVAGLVIAWPRLSFYYSVRVDLPEHLSAQEQQQFEDRRQEILLDKTTWGKNNSSLYNNIGILRSAVKDYSGAVSSFRLAIKKNPEDPRFWRNLAITYTYQDKFADAEEAFLQVFKLAPREPEYWLELGELYQFKLRDNSKARSFYLEAFSRSNNSIGVAQAFANFLETQEKNYPESIKYWQIVADGLEDPQKSTFLRHIAELKTLHNIK